MLIDTSRFPLVYLREPEAQAPADAGTCRRRQRQ